jgi:hypothetical protein
MTNTLSQPIRVSTRLFGIVSCLLAACAPASPDTQSRSSPNSALPAGSPGSILPGSGMAAAVSGSGGTLAQPGDNSGSLVVSAAGTSGAAASGSNCSEAAMLVYTVDQDGRFSSFDPSTNPPTFTDITSRLDCPVMKDFFGNPQNPYSMSVDRHADAWVLYNSGELFRVDTAAGSCEATSFRINQSGFQLMGMGFVANDRLSDLDTLYVAGGAGPDAGGSSRLGTVDMTTLGVTPAQALSGWPELTGTGLAELWGFYPDTTPPKIARINKQSAAEEMVYPLATLQGTPAAWAFAFWGGDFWVFHMRTSDQDTTVYRVDGTTGEMTTALSGTGRRIVGAGVSTCAPVSPL